MSTVAATDTSPWIAALLAGERRALSRCITWVENQTPQGAAVLGAIHPRLGRARVVGFTGSPGAGKSTLVNACVAELRRRGQRVAVAAVDPSSPYSGGAILGDRIRMGEHTNDDGVYIRSIASRGRAGGLSLTTARIVDVMDAAGFDVVIVETVGAGQSEVEIAEVAETKVVVMTPAQGDEIQAAKAGILEIADILVVNKCDLAGADRAVAHLLDLVHHGPARPWSIPVLRTVASQGDGVAELIDSLAAHAEHARAARGRAAPERLRRLLASLAGETLKQRLANSADEAVGAACTACARGEIGFDEAIDRLIALAPGRRP